MWPSISYLNIYSTKNIVRRSVAQATKGINVKISKHLFLSGYLQSKNNYVFVKIPLINDHLLYEYFFRWSVSQATKGLNV